MVLFYSLIITVILFVSACQTGQPTDALASSTPPEAATSTQVKTVTSITTPTETQPPTDTPIPSQTPTATEPTPTAVPTKGKTIVVTSTADSGPGTLRQALVDARSGDTITFDPTVFPPAAPVTIFLETEDNDSALPNITQGKLTIDGSNAGVILNGSNIQGDWVNGLEIYSDGNIIQGLQIVNFTGSGIALCGGSHNTIGGNRMIDTGPLGQGNLSSNNGIGIDLCATGSYNIVTGNIVGTDITMKKDWGNKSDGIWIENGITRNTIGPDNVIAHNDSSGIRITGYNTFGNTITQNSIHDNSFGIRLGDGGNAMLNPPLVSGFDLTRGVVSGTACANCTIEIFSDSNNQGKVYEGQTKTNSMGAFSYDHSVSFTGPYLTATATDTDGNTSEFPLIPTYALVQVENNHPKINLASKQSNELEDNKIGIHFSDLWHLEPEVFPDGILNNSHILNQGVKRARFAINDMDSDKVHWDKPENTIDPNHDDFITSLADNDILITYVLTFWDKENKGLGGDVYSPRFKTEEEIQRYLDHVRMIVNHFKDRIKYFEIWNEPNIENTIQWIELEDYINLVKRTVPVIRQAYPEAKIVVGGISYIREQYAYDYLLGILKSDDIMPLVDGISWHGMYGTSPEYEFHRQYYYNYPSIVKEIKDTAFAHGFRGVYISDELNWKTPATPSYPETYYSETVCAKYYARGIIMHLGMDVFVSQFYAVSGGHPRQIVHTLRNLSTVMAGADPSDLPLEIQSAATKLVNYTFSLPNGDHLVALWTDGIAVEVDPGIPATITIPNFSAGKVTGIDVLHSIQQELITSTENGNLVIRDFLMKDYPLILRLSE